MRILTSRSITCLVVLVGACGSDPPTATLPYDTSTTTVIGGGFDNAAARDGGSVAVDGGFLATGGSYTAGTPDGQGCIQLDNTCVQPQLTCNDPKAAADVLLDASGKVASVVCYPTGGVSVETFEGPVHDVGNNTVLVVDDKADGVDVMGDVTIDGNNVTLYGHGPDVSVIGGNLHIDKNNAVVRGVRIMGNVTIDKNNPSLIDCVIEGDLTISGNNVNVALCEVWGKLTITGNNEVLVSNRMLSAPDVQGQNLVCNDDKLFVDQNGDMKIESTEVGNSIDCSNKQTGGTTAGMSGKKGG